MRNIVYAAAFIGGFILPAGAAFADCPGGDDPPVCTTGAIHRLGANQRCFKVTVTPSHGPAINAAVVYGLSGDGVAEGLEKMLQEGASLSVVTDIALAPQQCGDGSFYSITGTRAPGY